MMRYFLILMVFLLTSFAYADDQKTLVIGTSPDFMPFEFIQDGDIVGFDIDLINAIAKELNLKITIKDMQFSALIPSLFRGDIDIAISGLSYTAERAKQVNLSQPYYFNKFAVIMVGEYDIYNPIKSGMKIGVQTGSNMHQWIAKQNLDIEVIVMDSSLQLIEDLKSHRLNGILMDESSAKEIIKVGNYKDFNIVPLAQTDDVGMSIAMQKNSTLLTSIDNALITLNTNGTISELKDKWGL